MEYATDLDGVEPEHLEGFFEGWPSPPSPERHLEILRGSSHVVLAHDAPTRAVIGFVNAISDGTLSAFIPLLEVLPAHRGRGIGSELVRRMLDELRGFYSIDVVCDAELEALLRPLRDGAIARDGQAKPMTSLGGQMWRLARHSAIYGIGGLVSRFLAASCSSALHALPHTGRLRRGGDAHRARRHLRHRPPLGIASAFFRFYFDSTDRRTPPPRRPHVRSGSR